MSASTIRPEEALIYAMVIASAADTDMSEKELRLIGRLVQTLPAFANFDPESLSRVAGDCAALLDDDEGLDRVVDMIARALPPRMRETAYALACETVAVDGTAHQEELRLLEILRHQLDVERLVAAAIERGIAARYRAL
ncbi:tellurite resistance TerB family protein [Roseospirillum parvum]|uniref:Tellurite resistance protein TerB n=1 Tax=Roseospirillum parvum TaxID=83401 RepID=A0A1G8BD76_9PROT|nr:tellurite resistance TerB family protein [Roseospirillum parvum]SDH31149.1 Tellurite resistance protein TerB [Roseospirillum parvum]